MTEFTHEQIENLLGAYALDAVDADEREAVELHLRECPRCRSEVADYREVAVLLAHSGAPAPEGVWDRILDELEPSPPLLRMPALPEGMRERDEAGAEHPQPPAVPSLAAARDRRSTGRRALSTRVMAGMLAAAAVVVAVVGFVAVRQTQRLDRVERAMEDVSIDRLATRALTDPTAANATLRSADGRVTTPAVVDDRGTGFLFASTMPELRPGQTYQLWGEVQGVFVSLGVFDGRTRVVAFQLGDAERQQLEGLAVTAEVSPGVPQPEHPTVVVGTI